MPRRKNYYNFGPKKRSAANEPDNKSGGDTERVSRVDDDDFSDTPDLMMPGNYAGRNHRSRKMPQRQPRLKP